MTYEQDKSSSPDVDVVTLAERHLELALATLTDVASHIIHDTAGNSEEVQGAALEVVAALRMLFVLRARMEDDVKRPGKPGGDPFGIDLESARSSIGSLLDSLRDEDGSDEVPE